MSKSKELDFIIQDNQMTFKSLLTQSLDLWSVKDSRGFYLALKKQVNRNNAILPNDAKI